MNDKHDAENESVCTNLRGMESPESKISRAKEKKAMNARKGTKNTRHLKKEKCQNVGKKKKTKNGEK